MADPAKKNPFQTPTMCAEIDEVLEGKPVAFSRRSPPTRTRSDELQLDAFVLGTWEGVGVQFAQFGLDPTDFELRPGKKFPDGDVPEHYFAEFGDVRQHNTIKVHVAGDITPTEGMIVKVELRVKRSFPTNRRLGGPPAYGNYEFVLEISRSGQPLQHAISMVRTDYKEITMGPEEWAYRGLKLQIAKI